MRDKICLVTGGTSGVGHAVATGLAAAGARVILFARDGARAGVAAERIRAATGTTVETLVADLGDLASVRAAASDFRRRYPRLDVLVGAAGILSWRRAMSADGYELTFATNHLGHVLLARELEDHLARAPGARYLAVAGSRGTLEGARLHLEDIAKRERGYRPIAVTVEAMLARVVWTLEASRRWEARGIRANVFFPGLVRSGLGRGLPWPLRLAASVANVVLPRGCPAGVRAAADPELESVSGRYISAARVDSFPHPDLASGASADLWELSARLVGR